MRKVLLSFLCFVLCSITSVKAIDIAKDSGKHRIVKQGINKPGQASFVTSDTLRPNPPDAVYHKKHRLFAALLAFPLGVFGLHRIYMHTSPIVPFIYIVTVGGLFGVLPFIDFVLILLNKDIHLTYTSNPHLFMWQKR